ncbi:putative beta-lysine N-acetyltransferase [Baia soyae]|uniref:Beta-lysine acetyltransferase n=1 Tax=Baia soyae TaxID=1544746 RepID=A0A4R2RY90_9BACL|nr:putative beta-lysine N-acetyltransferase [Baia soyae]TCP68553.1 beta-lysine acetyltransferase [Baia soyae]
MIDTPMHVENRVETGLDFTVQIYVDPAGDRLRVDDYRGNVFSIMKRIEEIAKQYHFTKVFVKARSEDWQSFVSRGYMLEGIFKGYFNGSDAYSVALYFSLERRTSDHWIKENEILQKVQTHPMTSDPKEFSSNYHMRLAIEEDAEQLANLYNTIFQFYPTPMNDETYVRNAIENGTIFYVVESEDQIVSAASAELNTTYNNAEITDCATLSEHRRHGFIKNLILSLESELKQRSIFCVYSLARSLSFGMNMAFHQLGYEYTGRLTKNCNIHDKFEDMSLWTKDLSV